MSDRYSLAIVAGIAMIMGSSFAVSAQDEGVKQIEQLIKKANSQVETIGDAKLQLQKTMDAYNGVFAPDVKDRRDAYKKLQKEMVNSDKKRADVALRSTEMNAEADKLFKPYRINQTPIYMEFLRGDKELPCTAWGNPTYNIKGWKGPCYLITDGHYKTFEALMTETPWEKYGTGNGDPRCENCMVHCGYEPTASLGLQAQRGDTWKTVKFNFGAKPKPTGRGNEIAAFNGVSSGNGHLTGKKAELSAQAS
jgi:cell fate (sporulation/competence/biofilm development) regulator YmcA (YheA/YmcA/DUF963 family)